MESEMTTRVQPKRNCKSSTVVADIVSDDMVESQIPLICEMCGKSFTSEIQLFRHMFMHDGKRRRRGRKRKLPEKRFKCDICDSSFIQKATLQMHLTSHESETFSCETCLAEFPTLGCLQKHTLLEHTPSWRDEIKLKPKPKKKDKDAETKTEKNRLGAKPGKRGIYSRSVKEIQR